MDTWNSQSMWRNTWPRRSMHFPHHTNWATTPLTMGTAKTNSLGPKRFRENKAFFQCCTGVDGTIMKQIITAVQQVFISTIMYLLTGFRQVTALEMIQLKHIFRFYGEIEETNLEKNSMKMMGAYEPSEPLAHLVYQLLKGWEFAIS